MSQKPNLKSNITAFPKQGNNGNDFSHHPIAAGFDLASARCKSEESILERLKQDPSLIFRLDQHKSRKKSVAFENRISCLANYYRVDERITPELFRIGQKLTETLRLVKPIDIYIGPNAELNAFCVPSKKGSRYIMVLYSGLVNAMDSQELLFTMGHEVGHAILNHGLATGLASENWDFSSFEIVQLRELERSEEISADRIGLLACQNPHAASKAIFKLSTQLSNSWLSFDEHAYASHFDTFSDLNEILDVEDDNQTHPKDSLRVKALLAFANSQKFATALNLSAFNLENEDMERAVQEMLAVVSPDPSYFHAEDAEMHHHGFMEAAALAIIFADGKVSDIQLNWLNTFLRWRNWTKDYIQARFSEEEFYECNKNGMIAHADNPCFYQSITARLDMIKTLCALSLFTKNPNDAIDLISYITYLLEINPDDANQVLEEARAEHEEQVAALSLKNKEKRGTQKRQGR